MNFTPAEVKKYNDLHKGLKMEDILKPVLENKFGELNKTKQYDSFDFINNNYVIELKTRNANWGQYPSLMFNESKLNKAKEIKDKEVYFFWKLKDGLYYWRYKEGEYNINLGGRTDRGKSEINRCAFINNEYIKNYNDLVLTN